MALSAPAFSLFDPQTLNFPEWFTSFRPAQEQAIDYALTSQRRFTCMGAPPGVGKSAIAWALGQLLGGKTVILTATLGLQDQYLEDFGAQGLYDIRGRSNFQCWEGGNCETGLRLGCLDRVGCPYSVAAKAWWQADIGVTSYAWWLAVAAMPGPRPEVDTLILDEAHLAVEWLSRALDFTIGERECRTAGLQIGRPGEEVADWVKLGPTIATAAAQYYEAFKAKVAGLSKQGRLNAARDLKRAEDLVDRARRLSTLDAANWVVSMEEGRDEGRVWVFESIWPGRYREKLFQNVKRVVLLSATLRPKTLALLGIARSDYDFKEWGRQFPAKNGPVIWLPTTRVSAKISPENEARWLERHRQILQARRDRKGLIHTVSYSRAKRIGEYLGSGFNVVMNGAADPDTQNAREAFDRHCRGPRDSVLVSPSFGTGWDFKGKRAEYQIISKIPLKDMRSKLMQARRERDPSYEDYAAAQDLVQSTGRPVRSDTDRGETLILDDTIAWWYRKAEDHFPRWWKYRREDNLPPALPLLKPDEA